MASLLLLLSRRRLSEFRWYVDATFARRSVKQLFFFKTCFSSMWFGWFYSSITWEEAILEHLWKQNFTSCWSIELRIGSYFTQYTNIMNVIFSWISCSQLSLSLAADILSFHCGEEVVIRQCLLKVWKKKKLTLMMNSYNNFCEPILGSTYFVCGKNIPKKRNFCFFLWYVKRILKKAKRRGRTRPFYDSSTKRVWTWKFSWPICPR